jgi:hypothetical protein
MPNPRQPAQKTEGLIRLERDIEEHPRRFIVRRDQYGRLVSAEALESGLLYIVMNEKGMRGVGFIV